MSSAKKILYKFTLGVLVFLVVCTFLSKSIASSIQPEVEVVRPVWMDLTASDEYIGEVVYENVYEVIYDFPVKVTNVLVRVGYEVNEGDVLVEIDATEYYLETKRQELNILKIQNMIAQTSDSNLIAELRLQLEIEEEELGLYKENYPTDGKIYAKISGIVYNLNAQVGEIINPGTNLAGIYDKTSRANVVFSLSERDAQKYSAQDEVVLYYKENGKSVTAETTVRRKDYDEAAKTYIYSASIKNEYLKHNQSVPLKITRRTRVYDIVIPLRAIATGGENKNYVFIAKERQGLFGTEYYTKSVEVEIIDKNDMYAALRGWAVSMYDDVILASSKYMTPGETVKVVNK